MAPVPRFNFAVLVFVEMGGDRPIRILHSSGAGVWDVLARNVGASDPGRMLYAPASRTGKDKIGQLSHTHNFCLQ